LTGSPEMVSAPLHSMTTARASGHRDRAIAGDARSDEEALKTVAAILDRSPEHAARIATDLDDEPTVRMLVVEVLEEAGFTVAKAEAGPEGRDAFRASFSFPLVLVLGGEEKGVRPGVAKRCRDSLFIPMPGGFESLNVAQAGGMILALWARALAG